MVLRTPRVTNERTRRIRRAQYDLTPREISQFKQAKDVRLVAKACLGSESATEWPTLQSSRIALDCWVDSADLEL